MKIVFATVGYIKLDRLSLKMRYTNNSGKRLKYIRFLKRYIAVYHFTIIIFIVTISIILRTSLVV